MRQVSLVLLMKKDKILLAMKKRGFGIGKYNGVGGKIEEGDRNVLDSAIRESEEEIGVKIKNPKKVAIMDFKFPEESKDSNQQVHVFLSRKWEGNPKETEEMKPKWFNLKDIPYEKMWDDDKFWLPLVLEGKKLKCKFLFNENSKIVDKEIKVVKSFEKDKEIRGVK